MARKCIGALLAVATAGLLIHLSFLGWRHGSVLLDGPGRNSQEAVPARAMGGHPEDHIITMVSHEANESHSDGSNDTQVANELPPNASNDRAVANDSGSPNASTRGSEEEKQLKDKLASIMLARERAQQRFNLEMAELHHQAVDVTEAESDLTRNSSAMLATQAELLTLQGKFAFGLGSIIAFTLICCCLLAYGCAAGYLCCCQGEPGSECSSLCAGSLGDGCCSLLGYSGTEEEDIAHLVTREARIMLVLPCIPIAFRPWATCHGGVPFGAYLVYLPFLVRARIIEIRLILALRKQYLDVDELKELLSSGEPDERDEPDIKEKYLRTERKCGFAVTLAFSIVFGTMEHLDWFTDGVFPVQAHACDATVTPLYAGTFLGTCAWPFASIVMWLRFWGIAVIVFCIGAIAQQATSQSRVELGGLVGDHVSAGTATFLMLSALMEDTNNQETPFHVAPVTAAISKAFLENLLGIWMQLGFFGLTFNTLGTAAKYKQLLSIGLGLACSLPKLVFPAWQMFKLIRGTRCNSVLGSLMTCYACAFALWMLTLVKLIMTFTCEEHWWNLTTGCMSL
eukprot:CAMPEP_0172889720 /NCGR_PEP_ID=MMETSP1075-20121228/139554_1 /TAXON_ID=2916 /ORGANISM="Ceratium fusus, Strain PA161109" /LENGTH=568 /DNA_ID=CAMNT_0013743845 /DNA_START=58 /DNA_END=1761 /DNA_ORIENTATION=-